jgi:hypothetical protein
MDGIRTPKDGSRLPRLCVVDKLDEITPKPEIRLGNDAGLVRRGSRTARNEGAASDAPTFRLRGNDDGGTLIPSEIASGLHPRNDTINLPCNLLL